MTQNDLELLGQFTREQSQDAFSELVNRRLNLVYSAALRQVRSPELAQEVSLSVFTQLARHADKLPPDTILTAWLYKVACNTAIDVVRREARRQARERIAIEMSALNESPADWAPIEGLLDEAMQSLDETDRTAVLLRYFENKSLREVGAALGASEDAAQKRVSRALERLHEFLSKRGAALGATSLAAFLSANAVQAAPAGLAAIISSGAVLGAAATSVSTAATITKVIAMTTFQKTIATLVIAGAVTAGLYEHHQASKLRDELQHQRDQQAALNNRIQQLEHARNKADDSVALLSAENEALKKRPSEVMKLRGQVGVLKQQNAQMGAIAPLSKATADPATKKLIRDQQKVGMGILYKQFITQLNLTPDQTDKFKDLLADHIMQNVDNVTAMLRDKPTTDQITATFSEQEAALQQQIQEQLGADGLAHYQDYTKNLLATFTADQFKEQLSGTGAEQDQKAAQLTQLIESASQTALAAKGLPADFQTMPILNFCNIASEQMATQNLQLLTDIYQNAAAQAGSFLSAADLAKFQQFQTTAIQNTQAALTLNRNLMAPISN